MKDFAKSFLVLMGAGLIGILSLYPTLRPLAEQMLALPEVPDLPLPALQAILLVNPLVLLLICVAIGCFVAPLMGLRSHLAEWARSAPPGRPALREQLGRAVLIGTAVGIAMLLLDALWSPFLGSAGEALTALQESQPRTVMVTLMGILYGGITEELMTRWGLMSLFAWALWRLTRRGGGQPGARVFWAAAVLAAVLFGAGHLGVVGAEVGLSPALVARTVSVNAVGGIVFGWLFWRHSLEAAMVAHASVHVVFTVVDWAGRLVGAG